MFDLEEDSNKWFVVVTALLLFAIYLLIAGPSSRDACGEQAQQLMQQSSPHPLFPDPDGPDAPEPPAPVQTDGR